MFCCLFFAVSPGIANENVGVDSQSDPQFLRDLQSASKYSIAILPMENLTVDGDIAYHFRTRLAQRLRAKGFSVIDRDIVDQKLRDLGVYNAGQLRLLSFHQLQKLTSADAFLSGVVEQAAKQHAGLYNSYVFTCSLKLQNREGKVLWVSLQERVAKRRFAIDPINMFLDVVLVEAGGKKQEAVYALADMMLANMPDGPVITVSQGDSLLDSAIQTTAVKK